MIVPMYQDLGTDFDDVIRARVESDRRVGKAYDYENQRWVQSDHCHIVFSPETAVPEVKTCGATLRSCEPYVADALYEYGLAAYPEDLALIDAQGRDESTRA